MFDTENPSCMEILCGRPSTDEPQVNLLFCNVSKRVLKNMVMFAIVLAMYIFFLSIIMGKRS